MDLNTGLCLQAYYYTALLLNVEMIHFRGTCEGTIGISCSSFMCNNFCKWTLLSVKLHTGPAEVQRIEAIQT